MPLCDILAAAAELFSLPFSGRKAERESLEAAKHAYHATEEARQLRKLHEAVNKAPVATSKGR